MTNRHFCYTFKFGIITNGLEKQDYTLNKNGLPCCPHDDSLPMKYEGISKLRSGVTSNKMSIVFNHFFKKGKKIERIVNFHTLYLTFHIKFLNSTN